MMLGINLVMAVGLFIVLGRLPAYNPNRKIQLLGSRFNPLPGERVDHAPIDAMAREDRPIQGTVQPS